MNKHLTPKEKRLLDYLKKKQKHDITSLEAIKNLGETRLSATVYLLRHKGYVITDSYEESTNRYGDTTHFKRYVLM